MTGTHALKDYQRGTWAGCGHSADAPVEHDPKRLHRHWCPVCEPGHRDRGCSGVVYRNVTRSAPRSRPSARCSLCGTRPARPYAAGIRCASHAPGSAVTEVPATQDRAPARVPNRGWSR